MTPVEHLIKHTVRCTQTLMTPVEHLAQTLIGSTVVTRTCSLCTAKDPCTSRPMAPADHRDANKHGRDGGRMRLQPPRTTRPVQQTRTHRCNSETGGRLAPDLNASEPSVMLYVHAPPQTQPGARPLEFSKAQQAAVVRDHKEDRRAHEDHHCCQ